MTASKRSADASGLVLSPHSSSVLKAFRRQGIGRLTRRTQVQLQEAFYVGRVRLGRFDHFEPEFLRLGEWLGKGDIAVDVGANVGRYTKRMAEIVGASGRVFAFEPVADTFRVLVGVSRSYESRNVTFLNLAASDEAGEVSLEVPEFDDHTAAHTRASVVASAEASARAERCRSIRLDSILLDQPVALVKLDIEGHELAAIRGMISTLERWMPTLIIEDPSVELNDLLVSMGYRAEEPMASSPNSVYKIDAARENRQVRT
jgi:FkbM family methyltransferase